MPPWAVDLVEQLWSFVAVALAVNALASASKRVADRFGWRSYRRSDVTKLVDAMRGTIPPPGKDPAEISGDVTLPADASWYDITLRVHPLVAGALFGLVPLPTLHVIDALAAEDLGSMIAARCAWFMLAGALSGQVYEAIKFAFTEGRTRLLGLIGRRPSTPPPSDSTSNEGR